MVRRRLAAFACAVAGVALALPALAAADAQDPSTNPCRDPSLALVCPDLTMTPPSDLHVVRAGGSVRLEATNHIINIGQGPLELRGTRRPGSHTFVKAYQAIRSRTRGHVFFPEAGWIYWKAIPGQGHYWKYWRAARFELWTLNPDGSHGRLVRIGPKLSYCFRDLDRVHSWARTPRGAVYPGCSQDVTRRHMQLGVSPGWADVYPFSYHENWISVTGLRGCFAFVHRADPDEELIEQREDNNAGQRIVRLPPRGGSVAPRGCPGAR
ncbi:MAG TPA: hypothetical protein VFT50_10540 [Baekduia sp.]|nr:hypothetical protein [Baekduia sp.]